MGRGIKMESFGMSSNLSCYQLKIDYYKPMMLCVNLMVTTKQIHQKEREKRVRERKLNISQTTREMSKRRRREHSEATKTARKQLTKWH